MEKVEFNGLMEKFMMDNIRTIENTVLGHLAGLMEENMLETGKMENNMEEDNIIYLIKAKR